MVLYHWTVRPTRYGSRPDGAPALVLAQRAARDGLRQHDPPPRHGRPRPPAHRRRRRGLVRARAGPRAAGRRPRGRSARIDEIRGLRDDVHAVLRATVDGAPLPGAAVARINARARALPIVAQIGDAPGRPARGDRDAARRPWTRCSRASPPTPSPSSAPAAGRGALLRRAELRRVLRAGAGQPGWCDDRAGRAPGSPGMPRRIGPGADCEAVEPARPPGPRRPGPVRRRPPRARRRGRDRPRARGRRAFRRPTAARSRAAGAGTIEVLLPASAARRGDGFALVEDGGTALVEPGEDPGETARRLAAAADAGPAVIVLAAADVPRIARRARRSRRSPAARASSSSPARRAGARTCRPARSRSPAPASSSRRSTSTRGCAPRARSSSGPAASTTARCAARSRARSRSARGRRACRATWSPAPSRSTSSRRASSTCSGSSRPRTVAAIEAETPRRARAGASERLRPSRRRRARARPRRGAARRRRTASRRAAPRRSSFPGGRARSPSATCSPGAP